ncbi:MAG: MFS transporter [Deltaproteobacteria bacterium]|nr:MFS transporter [Deltaproteobacteria bacterium]
MGALPPWLLKLAPILFLLAAIAVVVSRLPKVDLGHSEAFKRRRLMNWVPLGLTYAFLYFGRYNLSALAGELDVAGLLPKADFNAIDGYGAWVYGIAFLLNGPLTDRFGGRATMLVATVGSALSNVGMALAVQNATGGDPSGLKQSLVLLNAANMYFQSFGAVSIVKVNAPWFHVRERGVLGGLFGVLISLGLYFSYDWSLAIGRTFGFSLAFWIPAAVLALFAGVTAAFVRDSPSTAGFAEFDTGDASSGTGDAPEGLVSVLKRMFSQRVIWIVVAVEFCSGFLRQAVMKQYRLYAKGIGDADSFVYENWGMLLCVAGILGGVFAGFISDHVFGSRRGPVSSVLYAGLAAGAGVAMFTLGSPVLGWAVVFMSLCVIGVHGMLSGTASMDFGGKKNAGVVTGIIDGFVYLGTGAQAFLYGAKLPKGELAKDPANWKIWPGAMLPVALVGLGLCATIWNARPAARQAPPAPLPRGEEKDTPAARSG